MKIKLTNIIYSDEYKRKAPRNLPSEVEVEADYPLQAALSSVSADKLDFVIYFAIGKALGSETADAVLTADIEAIP